MRVLASIVELHRGGAARARPSTSLPLSMATSLTDTPENRARSRGRHNARWWVRTIKDQECDREDRFDTDNYNISFVRPQRQGAR